MKNYFTRKNMKNWKWWLALLLMVITVIMMLPLVVIVLVVDAADIIIGNLDNLITRIIDKLDDVMSKLWMKVGKWVKS